MFTFNKDVTATNCEPGVTRKILCYSDDLMMCEIHFEKGSKGRKDFESLGTINGITFLILFILTLGLTAFIMLHIQTM